MSSSSGTKERKKKKIGDPRRFYLRSRCPGHKREERKKPKKKLRLTRKAAGRRVCFPALQEEKKEARRRNSAEKEAFPGEIQAEEEIIGFLYTNFHREGGKRKMTLACLYGASLLLRIGRGKRKTAYSSCLFLTERKSGKKGNDWPGTTQPQSAAPRQPGNKGEKRSLTSADRSSYLSRYKGKLTPGKTFGVAEVKGTSTSHLSRREGKKEKKIHEGTGAGEGEETRRAQFVPLSEKKKKKSPAVVHPFLRARGKTGEEGKGSSRVLSSLSISRKGERKKRGSRTDP